MSICFDYNPSGCGAFQDERSVMLWIAEQLRTDDLQQWSSPQTRMNLYFLRGTDGRLQHFVQVQGLDGRLRLRRILLGAVRDIPVAELRHERISFEWDSRTCSMYEAFSDLVEVALPRRWGELMQEEGQHGSFLDSSVAFILHADEDDGYGTGHLHVHRLSVIDPLTLKKR